MDASFTEEIKSLGGISLGKCYQCGSCTANCPLTAEIKAFPRRTLRFIQLGLGERALRTPDMWLCSACLTCKAACPREADPGEIMAALRRYAYSRYSWLPRPTRTLTTSPKLVATLAVAFMVGLLALVYSASEIGHAATTVDFAAFLPFTFVDAAGVVLGSMVAFGIGINSFKMWKMIGRGSNDPPQRTISQRLRDMVNVIVREVALQRTLRKCNTGRLQWIAHLSLVVGFTGAAITTTLMFALNPGGKPFPLDHPVKILGNVSAALLLLGAGIMIAKRIFQKSTVGRTYFQDGLFLSLLFVVAITGTLSEVARLLNASILAYSSYSVHLVSITLLLGLAPYTKFAHAIYRPLAMYIAKLRGWPD
jgi:nitrate reductase gamma subunit